MSESLRNPALEPPESVLTLIADYGLGGGGWGPAAVQLPNMTSPAPFVYTGDATEVLMALHILAQTLAREYGIEARICRFTEREDLAVYEP